VSLTILVYILEKLNNAKKQLLDTLKVIKEIRLKYSNKYIFFKIF